MSSFMRVIALRQASLTYPTGRKTFSVMQAFPAGLTAEEADPFLMLDFFGPTKSAGVRAHADDYQVGWHPHRGMDIVTYIREGIGRHADSLGNREVFTSPGVQWCSVGSGIEHAEAGGTPAGHNTTGFQIWLNVPSLKKMDAPRYGTHGAEELQEREVAVGVRARVLSGTAWGVQGPIASVQPLQMVDYSIGAHAILEHEVPAHLDNAMVFVYAGQGVVEEGGAAIRPLAQYDIVRFDASDASARRLRFRAGEGGAFLLLMSGKRLLQVSLSGILRSNSAGAAPA